jgi:hypothetical protein
MSMRVARKMDVGMIRFRGRRGLRRVLQLFVGVSFFIWAGELLSNRSFTVS